MEPNTHDDLTTSISRLVGIHPDHIKELISSAPLSGYVGLMDAVKSNDADKAKEVVKSLHTSNNSYALGEPEQEATPSDDGSEQDHAEMQTEDSIAPQLNNQQRTALQRLASKMPKTNIRPVGSSTTGTSGSVGTSGTSTMSTQQNNNNSANNLNSVEDIVGVNADDGTIAVQNTKPGAPQNQQQVDIKSIKDPKQIADIETLMRNSGITIR